MFQSARRAGKTFLSGAEILRAQNRLFKGEIGQWNGMTFKDRGTHLTDFQQRLSFAVVSCVMPATVWLSPDYAASFAAGVGLLLLTLFWVLERSIQRARVERFAEALDPVGDDLETLFRDAKWEASVVKKMFGAQLAANSRSRGLLAMLSGGENSPIVITRSKAPLKFNAIIPKI